MTKKRIYIYPCIIVYEEQEDLLDTTFNATSPKLDSHNGGYDHAKERSSSGFGIDWDNNLQSDDNW